MTTPTAQNVRAPRSPFDAESFGAALIEIGALDTADWTLAREVARERHGSILRSVLDLGQLGEDDLADRLASWTGLARWRRDGQAERISPRVPVEFMRSTISLVLGEGDDIRIVIADPSDDFAPAALSKRFPDAPISIGTHREISATLDSLAGLEGDVPGARSIDRDGPIDVDRELSDLRDQASEVPVIRFLNETFEKAIDLGASDVHLERFDRRVALRYRVDGALFERPPPSLELVEPILCRIKIMAGLDIAERRRAQDGRLRIRLRGRSVDARLSLVPTLHGQDAVLRIQNRQKLVSLTLSDLGFDDQQLRTLHAATGAGHGIILITGPTGSGKTTTLYALLRTIVCGDRKIVTVEDPVEYAMEGVNQIQINPAVDLNFSNSLRHVLRHDPDVILIGEIRDQETARIAFQAALTGHLVLSTLHTNDVPSTFVRLIDMGIEPYLVGAAIELITAQRLLRCRCTDCAGVDEQRAACKACGGLGYRGRTAVMECASLSPPLKRLLHEGADEQHIRRVLVEEGFESMGLRALRLAEQGVTDHAEVVRALGQKDLEPHA